MVALWLSEEALRGFGGKLLDTADRVPSHLALALVDRLTGMTGSEAARRFVLELAGRDRFNPTTADDLDDIRARMLLAMSVLDPEAALAAMVRIFDPPPASVPGDVLASIEELLWVHATFDRTLEFLLRLAINDPATHTYGPRPMFEQTFQLVLSGTVETYVDRVTTARRLARAGDLAAKSLIAQVLSGAFDLSATRGVMLRGRASTREGWYPSREEISASLTAAWDLLLELSNEQQVQAAAARSVAHAIRACLRAGLEAKVEADLPQVEWAGPARAELLHELRLAHDHDTGPTPDQRDLLARLLLKLKGEDFAARLQTAMGAEPYQLESFSDGPVETFLSRLADDMARDPASLRMAVLASSDGNPRTVHRLFFLFGSRVYDDSYRYLLDPPAATPALIGFIAGRDVAGSSDWATGQAREWLGDRERCPSVPALVTALSPSDERAILAVDAVGAGADPYELSLLAFGRRAERLEAATVVRVIEALGGRAGVIQEHALAIVSGWLDVPDRTAHDALVDAAVRLIDASLLADDKTATDMSRFYRTRILTKIPDDPARLLPRTIAVLKADAAGTDELGLICRAVDLDAGQTADAIAGLVADALAATSLNVWARRLSRLKVLSALSSCSSPDLVVDALRRAGLDDPALLFQHVAVADASGGLDPMFARLIQLGRDNQGVWAAAAWSFEHPEDFHWGPESVHTRQRAEAASRLAGTVEDPLLQRWAAWTAGALTERANEAQ